MDNEGMIDSRYLPNPCPHCGRFELLPPADDYTGDEGADGYLATLSALCDHCDHRTPTEDLN